MASLVEFSSNANWLRFIEFPDVSFPYQKRKMRNDPSFIRLGVVDINTRKISSIFIRISDLENQGISFPVLREVSHNPLMFSWLMRVSTYTDQLLEKVPPILSGHLAVDYLTFFEDKPLANRMISFCLYNHLAHLKGNGKLPGMYFDFSMGNRIFINLKKTRLGQGSYGKVKKALWLNPPDLCPRIVARKVYLYVIRSQHSVFTYHAPDWDQEIAALVQFPNKRGIISIISVVRSESKFSIIFPSYDCNLYFYCIKRPFNFTVDQKLNLISQWLGGLATIFEKGIHGDLKPMNLLLSRGGEAVIADMGAYRPHGGLKTGLTSTAVAPPEYFSQKIVSTKHDVWGMGLSIYELFSKERLCCWTLTDKQIVPWVSSLTPDWALEKLKASDMPPFLIKLVNQMLDPRVALRPDPKETLLRFSSGMSQLFSG